jgi:Crp-like helix-turn-helix domain
MQKSQNLKEDWASGNFILASLSPVEYEWLRPQIEEVELNQGDVLYGVRERITNVYFPTTCLLSWTNSTDLGESVEVSITGNEGIAGGTLSLGEDISPWQTEVELSGKAFKLSARNFMAALHHSANLQRRVAAFMYLKMVQLSQSALCHRFHSAEERLCRWLLTAQDHIGTSDLSLTREILADMIGASRPTVSLSTGILQTAGLIRSHRGRIIILNQEGMEDAACECYQIVKQAREHYLTEQSAEPLL